jgi:sulfur carrier protein
MLDVTINGQARTLPEALTVSDLVRHLGHDPRRIAVEVNREVVPAARHAEHHLASGDAVEIVTLVGG